MKPQITEKEYTIFCDESDRSGRYYSNFYGGVRIPASQIEIVSNVLKNEKVRLGLTSEIKWSKVDAGLVERYEQFTRLFFDQMEARRLCMRVMFTQNALVPVDLSIAQLSESYYLLYYQFLKHGFGLSCMPEHTSPPRLRVYLDEIGDNKEQISKFKGFIKGLADTKTVRQAGGIILTDSAITEVRSHEHILMQALDVVLGSMTFRLNDKHKNKPEGARRRGKRTIAKERLYKFILKEIKRVTKKEGFNIGISTGLSDETHSRWVDPYRHWLFKPKGSIIDKNAFKPKK